MNRRFLHPCSPGKTRIMSPGRKSSVSSTGQSGYVSRGSLASSVSVPVSPTAPSSKYHQGCVPPSASFPSGFPRLVNSGAASGMSGGGGSNRFIISNNPGGNEVSSTTSSSTSASTIRKARNSRSRSRSRSQNSSRSPSSVGVTFDERDLSSNSSSEKRSSRWNKGKRELFKTVPK